MSVWISYIFIHVAYLLTACTGLFVRKGRDQAVFGAALSAVSGGYFFLELIVGVIFIWMAPENYKTALIMQVILAAFYLVALISNILANDRTADAVERQTLQVQYLKECSAILKGIMEQVTDKTAGRKVERVYDLIRSSPAKSGAGVADLEMRIIDELGRLQELAENGTPQEIGSCADRIYRMAGERNRQLKLGN